MDTLFDNDINVRQPIIKEKVRRITELTEITEQDEFRFVFGINQLVKCMNRKPADGKSYHILSGGLVDLLCHVVWLLKYYSKIKYLFISAWAISGSNILFLEKLHKEKKIDQCDVLVGDIFPVKYKMEWKKLIELQQKGFVRNVYKSTIHSKILLIETSDGDKIVVESSANCNMNPRVEQSCVTKSDKLFNFYYTYFMELFEKESSIQAIRNVLKFEKDEYIDNVEGIAK